MNTDIEYLTLLERDLIEAAEREAALEAAPISRRRRFALGWGTIAAAIVPILVVAGLIGWLVTGGTPSNIARETLRAAAPAGGHELLAPGASASPAPDTSVAAGGAAPAMAPYRPANQLEDLSKIG